MIKVGLLGLGKTGKVVAESFFNDKKIDLVFVVKHKLTKAKQFNFTVETKEMLPSLMKTFKPDALVDFSHPDATLKNLTKIPPGSAVVVATTGFTARDIKMLGKHGKNKRILFAPNISDGINILIKASKMIKDLWKCDIEIIESHFKTKKDAPSGTAKKISEVLGGHVPVHSIRAGGIVGIHEVVFVTPNQKLTLKHESFSREVFAVGAKRAIEWIKNKPNGFYEISEIYK